MYIPKPFKQDDFAQIKNLMAECPLATIIANVSDDTHACHIPLFWEDDGSEYGVLIGHVFKKNPIVTEQVINDNWLVIFQDTGCYISPSWYPNKAITHKEVPTWNYRAVHCSVEPSMTTDVNDLKFMVGKLADIHEMNQPNPWSLDDAPADYIEKMCKAIVGFRLKIVDVQAQFKLSQNKDEATRASILMNLAKSEKSASQTMDKHIIVD